MSFRSSVYRPVAAPGWGLSADSSGRMSGGAFEERAMLLDAGGSARWFTAQ